MANDPSSKGDRPVRLVVGPWPDETPRYELRRLLGEGGMGEVNLALDQRIGRQIAVKTVHKSVLGDAALDRFLREARVQGQLEHPSIVPVYDLARSVDGQFHFTMRRVQGRTLQSIVAAVAKGDTEATAAYPLRRLLAAFDQVCLAIAFAHSRGVIHRDLKPSNIMLGDFGEVYVLDWGLAKVLSSDDRETEAIAAALLDGERTAAGAILGTLGYMAPEQVRDAAEVDDRADVYALGAILFEILTLEPLHAGDAPQRAHSTLLGGDARAKLAESERDIPPELEAIVVRATARDPRDRPTARALHEAVLGYLDNDRDVELRRASSARHAEAAAIAAHEALGGAGSDRQRRRALREAGRALALDPTNDGAMRTMMDLLLHPPTEAPPEVVRQLDEASRQRASVGARLASVSYLSLFLYVPLLVWMGVRSWLLMGALFGAIVVIGAMTYASSRLARQGAAVAIIAITLNTLVVAATTTVSGPFLVAPGFAAATSLALALHFDRFRKLTAALGCLAVIAPLLLERTGVVPASYTFVQEGMLVVPRMVSLPENATLTFLVMASITTIGITTAVGAYVRDALTEAERRLVLHAWQLQHVVADASRDAGSVKPPAGSPADREATPSEASADTVAIGPPAEIAGDRCLTDEEIVECAAGHLDPARLKRALSHIDGCASCREIVSVLAKSAG